jgi:hypothetical protein
MKGPGERLKYDFRRVWECPVCRHRERTGGDVTFRLCDCQRKIEPPHRAWMKLVHEWVRKPDIPQPEQSLPAPSDPADIPLSDLDDETPPELTQPSV